MVPPPASPFGGLLRQYRLAAGLSQEALAERARLSVQAVGALERGVRRAPYRDTIDLLADALGLAPEERARLHAAVSRGRTTAVRPPAAPDPARTNLPAPAGSFVGREHEQATVLRLLDASRLLTLTGTGGVGKTRLATHVAAGLVAGHPDGVWLVELAGLGDPALVPQAVAQALDLREQPGRPLPDTLVDALRAKALLLVLDNCEHLRPAVGELTEMLLRAAPGLRILATSREALGIIGETVWWVPSLPLPEAAPSPSGLPRHTALSVRRAESAQLFDARAAVAHAAFALTDANAPAVAAICRRLDGIPLAIELAAARARILTPEQIAARLDARFRLLTGGNPDALPRHQTLRAALDWSYDLLSEPERRLLQRLAVFAGGCQIEAAEAVCVGDLVALDALFDLLSSLAEKSLLAVEYRGETARYVMLETIRQYAAERLDESGDGDAVQRLHGQWALALAEGAAPHLRGPTQAAWTEQLEMDHDNLRAALRWTLDTGQTTHGLRIAGALGTFWYGRGYLAEGRRWLDALLARRDRTPLDVRARALLAAGNLAERQGSFDDAAAFLEEALELAREMDDKHATAQAQINLGIIDWRRGDLSGATSRIEEALALARIVDARALISRCLNNLGVLAVDQGHLETARDRYDEALTLARSLGDGAGIAIRLDGLARVAILTGDLADARRYAEQSLAESRRLGNSAMTPIYLRRLAETLLRQQDYDAAMRHAEQALALSRETGNQFEQAEALQHVAWIALEQRNLALALTAARDSLSIAHALGTPRQIWVALDRLGHIARGLEQAHRAIRLFAAARVLRESTGEAAGSGSVQEIDEYVAGIAARCGDAEVAAAWAEGAALAPAAVVAYALADQDAAFGAIENVAPLRQAGDAR